MKFMKIPRTSKRRIIYMPIQFNQQKPKKSTLPSKEAMNLCNPSYHLKMNRYETEETSRSVIVLKILFKKPTRKFFIKFNRIQYKLIFNFKPNFAIHDSKSSAVQAQNAKGGETRDRMFPL